MRIAISSQDEKGLESQVSHHFGRCPFYILVDTEEQEVKSVQSIANPFFEKHEPGMVPNFINEQKSNVMISGGMGRRAIDFFDQFGIQVVTGASGTVDSTLKAYFNNELSSSAPCKESESHQH
ncbi:MAG: NifB/NifX family molybdenum-iron cluster-binding protein [Anaerolineaceae bacterium]|nr:NifB/NifX family molybdenum-iron cluster-binding protein [Anaerolineaceae bacterium]